MIEIILNYYSIAITSISLIIFLFMMFRLVLIIRWSVIEEKLFKNKYNSNREHNVVKFPYKIYDNKLDINFPQVCHICGGLDYKGDYMIEFIGKEYALIPLCEKHYKKLKSILGKRYTNEVLKNNIGKKNLLNLLIPFLYTLISVAFILIFAPTPDFIYFNSVIVVSLYIFAFMYFVIILCKMMFLSIFRGVIDTNFHLSIFSSKNYFTLLALNDDWMKELENLNPNKKIEVFTVPKLTTKYLKAL